MNRRFLAIALSAALLGSAAPLQQAIAAVTVVGLSVTKAWSRPAPKGGNGAGFVVIQNTGGKADKLVSVASPVAGRVEIHESMIMSGQAMMHPRPGGVPLPAGGKAELKPGGWHIMFIGLKQPFKAGDKVPVTLTFQKAGKVQVEFEVRTTAP